LTPPHVPNPEKYPGPEAVARAEDAEGLENRSPQRGPLWKVKERSPLADNGGLA